jgi:5S rRNA maturation endonuclease (ribonuclease M5)
MIDKHAKAIQAFGAFVLDFMGDLNRLAEDGWAVMVEGQRDVKALRNLGYVGRLTTVSSLERRGVAAFGGSNNVVILTDLDREGSVLASRYLKTLTHEGLRASLTERRRLKQASKGVFLHIENLSRFEDSPPHGGPPHVPARRVSR